MEILDRLQNKKNGNHRERDITGTVKKIENLQYSCDGFKG
jgi:hypothetical protein